VPFNITVQQFMAAGTPLSGEYKTRRRPESPKFIGLGNATMAPWLSGDGAPVTGGPDLPL